MARNLAINVENNVNKGLITEATGLNFPENAAVETFNCIFNENGAVSRRLGFEDEPDVTTTSVTRNNSAINEYVWNAVGGNGDTAFVVVQIGTTLYFYNNTSYLNLSSNKKSFTVDLGDFIASGANFNDISSQFCDFSSGLGYLFVVHPYCEPFYVTYTASTDSITSTAITIKVRDLQGLDDGFEPGERRTSTTVQHTYNLYNQGWFSHGVDGALSSGDHKILVQFLTYNLPPEGGTGVYPSNSDVWWTFRNSSLEISQSEVRHRARSNSLAPKGHYIMNAFNLDRSAISLVDATDIGHSTSGITAVTSSYYRPKAVEFFAGRVWYTGVDYQGYNNKLYYSQLIEKSAQFGLCYQVNDPVSETLTDLLPTDGGIIQIPDIGTILKIVSLQTSLLVFASNGVWSIGGSGPGVGFKATDFSITKLSNQECRNKLSFVKVNGIPMWWGNEAIYTVQVDPTLGNLQVVSLTDKTIHSFLNEIPINSKLYIKGCYNIRDKIVSWLYRTEEGSSLDENMNYDAVLNLNTITGAFYPWTISDSSKKINGIIATRAPNVVAGTDTVVDSTGATVVNGSAVTVTANFSYLGPLAAATKFFSTKNSSGTTYDSNWVGTTSKTYKDWYNLDSTGVNYSSYFDTGYKVRGQGSTRFEDNYITVYMLKEDNSSCFLQNIRNFATSSSSTHLFSTAQQVYNPVSNYMYTIRRIRSRGAAKAIQLRFSSEAGKPFTVIGWSLFESSNAIP